MLRRTFFLSFFFCLFSCNKKFLLDPEEGVKTDIPEVCNVFPQGDIHLIVGEAPTYDEPYKVFELDPSTGARCLDGTNFKILYHAGKVNKFMIKMDGAGFCGVDGLPFLDSCVGRLSCPWGCGGSATWGEDQKDIVDNSAMGPFSSDCNTNPDFCDWHKIRIKSCDGSNNQGHLDQPINYEGHVMYFRGYDNVYQTLEYAKQHWGLFDAEELILYGQSSGGQAVYYWSIFLESYLPKTVKFMGIPEIGIFMDVVNVPANCHYLRSLLKNLATYTDSASSPLFQTCPWINSPDVWKCMAPQYIFDFIDTPLFIADTLYDNAPFITQDGIYCLAAGTPYACTADELSQMEDIRSEMLEQIHHLQHTKKFWGSWVRSCFEHGLAQCDAWYDESVKNVVNDLTGLTANYRSALRGWYQNLKNEKDNKQNWFIDGMTWQNNPRCLHQLGWY